MSRGLLLFSLSLVFVTGMTGLIYQVAWQNYLAIHLGSHSIATALVLSVFFLALSLGYTIFGRFWNGFVANKLLYYGLIEGGIGIFCLFSPSYFHFLHGFFGQFDSFDSQALAMNWIFAFLYIGPPTFLMGGTIPILTEGLSKSFSEGHRVHAWVYGVNTLGAFLGTLISGFFLIEKFGLPLTLMYTSLINLVICLVTYGFYKKSPDSFLGRGVSSEVVAKPKVSGILLFVSFFSGFYVFALESLIIRLAGLSVGGTVYAYSMIVACFILAIALGSFLVGRLKETVGVRFLLYVQLVLLFTMTALYLSVPSWGEWLHRVRLMIAPLYMNFNLYWVFVFLVFLWILIIPVTLMGTNLPLIFHFLKKKDEEFAASVGRIYSINSIGSAFGAVMGGYWLFYHLDADQIFKLSLFLIALTIFLISSWLKLIPRRILNPLFLTILLILFFLPKWSTEAFVPGLYTKGGHGASPYNSYDSYINELRKDKPKVNFTQWDPILLAAVTEDKGDKTLWVNGKPDAATKGDHVTRSLTALLPLSLAPKVENVFIVGLGAGLSTAITTALPEVKSVRVAEISEGVANSLPEFEKFNKNLMKERSEKFDLVVGDAYKILANQKEKYDVILSEPSNPWVSGVEKIYSLEFLEEVKSHLNQDGFYAQWFPFFSMNNEVVLAVMNNFRETFPWVTLWSSSGSAHLILAGFSPPKIEGELLESRFSSLRSWFEPLEFERADSILGLQILTHQDFVAIAENGGRHSMEFPKVAYQAGRSFLANITISSDELIGRFLDHAPQRREGFLFENEKRSKEFYEEALHFLRGGGLRTTQGRLSWKLFNDHGTDKLSLSKEQKEIFAFLAGKKKDLEGAGDKVDSLIQAGYQLASWREGFDLGKVAALLPKKCADGPCFRRKYQLLHLLRERRQQIEGVSKESISDPKIQSRLEKVFSESF